MFKWSPCILCTNIVSGRHLILVRISEGPVRHMSMAVKGTSRTPYSDATQVNVIDLLEQRYLVALNKKLAFLADIPRSP